MGACLQMDAVAKSRDFEFHTEGCLGYYFECIDGQFFLNVHFLIEIQFGTLQEILGRLGMFRTYERVLFVGQGKIT